MCLRSQRRNFRVFPSSAVLAADFRWINRQEKRIVNYRGKFYRFSNSGEYKRRHSAPLSSPYLSEIIKRKAFSLRSRSLKLLLLFKLLTLDPAFSLLARGNKRLPTRREGDTGYPSFKRGTSRDSSDRWNDVFIL